MARRVEDSRIGSRDARAKLKARGKPYWREVERGVHVGYRKLSGKAGTWWARYYLGKQKYKTERLGIADDLSNADGQVVIGYWRAVEMAREQMVQRARSAAGLTGPLTVGQAVETYICGRDQRESLRAGRTVRSNARHRIGRHLLGRQAHGKQDAIEPAALAKVELHKLEDADLRRWVDGLPAMKIGTRRRLVNDLKAALNAAYQNGRKGLPPTLPAVIKHGLRIISAGEDDDDTGVRDNQILTDAQVTRLIAAARETDEENDWAGDLYRLVVTLASSGARYSQVARLKVRDLQVGRILMPNSRKGRGKTGGSTPIPVGPDVRAALQPATAGRAGGDWLLERPTWRQVGGGKWEKAAQRRPWQAGELTRPWKLVRKRAGMPAVIAYSLRHSSIVRGLRAGLPVTLVSAVHDTSVTMIEKHYGAFLTSGLEELAQRAIVPLVPQDGGAKVVPLRGGGA